MDEQTPPAMRTIDEIEAEYFTPAHAPYKDGKTAKYERKINQLNSEVKRLEKEVNRLNNGNLYSNNDDSTSLGTFEATAYTADCKGCIGITKTGIDVRNSIHHAGKRIIAVDPEIIPLGSSVRIQLVDGSTIEATAQDTGGAIKGNRIDVLVNTYDEAVKFGRQSVEIELLN